MVLYTCFGKGSGAPLHPCAVAVKALDQAGVDYELKTVGGLKNVPFGLGVRGDKRARIRELSGQERVPILVLDDGEVVTGSKQIAAWAKASSAR